RDLIHERMHGPLDAFTAFGDPASNPNSTLTVLWMWFVGPDAWGTMYRLPMVGASLGTIALAWLIGRRYGKVAACVAVVLVSCSYLLIHYGTEARGYAPAIFFAFLGWHALLGYIERRSGRFAALFWAAVVLGFLAHAE